ncbi:amino acid transporter AAAP family [Gracilaria domingensis]|nr:amino acid transporter AAAP family [Gracilaria domingensis]
MPSLVAGRTVSRRTLPYGGRALRGTDLKAPPEPPLNTLALSFTIILRGLLCSDMHVDPPPSTPLAASNGGVVGGGARYDLLTDIGNMLKAFIGINFMYVAYAFSNAGLWRGAVALVVITFITEHCCLLLIDVKNASPLSLPDSSEPEVTSDAVVTDKDNSTIETLELSGEEDLESGGEQTRLPQHSSYGDIARAVGGPSVGAIINFAVVLTQFGFCVGYLIFLSQTLHDLLKSSHAVMWFVLVPLPALLAIGLLSSIRSLGPFSILANIALFIGFVSVVTFLAKHFQWQPSNPPMSSFPLFFGQMTAALEGIGLVVPVQSSMKDPHRFPLVLRIALVILSTVLMVMGILGFASFGDKTRSIILLNFGDSPIVAAVKIVLMVGILFTYPLQIVPVFQYFEHALLPRESLEAQSSSPPEVSSSTVSAMISSGFFVCDWRRIGVRFMIVFSTALVAILAGGSFGLFQSLVGSLGGTVLAYCAPAVLHNIAFKDSGVLGAYTSVTEIMEIHKGNAIPV